jgi:hypothetical protein
MPLNYTVAPHPLFAQLRHAIAFRGSRRWVFQRFWETMRPTPEMRVADFGVSGHRGNKVFSYFERTYPWKDRITVIGRVEEGASWYPEEFPEITFLEADLRSIPLPDNYFDIGLCNAVVEHAGSSEQQRELVAEVCRVSRKVMFTTPNKWCPIEHHTLLPFVHWLPGPLFRAILRRLGHDFLAREENLNPVGPGTLLSLFPPDRDTRLVRGAGWMPLTSLLCVSTAREVSASANATP